MLLKNYNAQMKGHINIELQKSLVNTIYTLFSISFGVV